MQPRTQQHAQPKKQEEGAADSGFWHDVRVIFWIIRVACLLQFLQKLFICILRIVLIISVWPMENAILTTIVQC